MYGYFIEHKIIPSVQCGFRKKFGTSVALASVTDDIIRACDKKMASILILLDFSKAFDRINHNLLVSKLKYYGFDIESCKIIKSYLYNRYQTISYNDMHSDRASILSGVPQGSVLGPLLFLIYTSDILKSLKCCNVQAFADDTQIYCDDIKEAERNINYDLQIISNLSEKHNLKLNSTKSCMMIFGNQGKINAIKNDNNLYINNTRLDIVECTKM